MSVSENPLLTFLNTDLGLLVTGFFLTTLAGGLITSWYKLISKKQEVRFQKLHEDRAKAIEKLHEKTIEIKILLERLAVLWSPTGTYPPEPIPEEIIEQVEEYRIFVERYKIYFGQRLNELIEASSSGYGSVLKYLKNMGEIIRGAESNAKSKSSELVPNIPQEYFQNLTVEEIMGPDDLFDGKKAMSNAHDMIIPSLEILDMLLEALRVEFRKILGVK
jgi:hypothetical protein